MEGSKTAEAISKTDVERDDAAVSGAAAENRGGS